MKTPITKRRLVKVEEARRIRAGKSPGKGTRYASNRTAILCQNKMKDMHVKQEIEARIHVKELEQLREFNHVMEYVLILKSN